MSIEIMVSGNLATAPIERQSRGQGFLSFTMCTNLATEDGPAKQWFDVNVSGPLMVRASRLSKGDGVWCRGHVTLRRYVHKNEERTAWQMDCNELITDRETYTR